jgi:S1-C subfamily serine protease
MGITASYRQVKRSIVAFTLKYNPVFDPKDPPPLWSTIVGTGFVVGADGIVATNAHVARMFGKLPKPPGTSPDEWPVQAVMLHMTSQGIVEVPLELIGVGLISGFTPGKHYYGPKEGPDLAFVHLKVRGLPTVEIDSSTLVEEGMELATAGFPMGTDALTAPGWLHQLTPTLQRGIVSAVLPFVCESPHGYAINVMSQGGSSGSPVFSTETGAVVGVLYGGLHDFDVTLEQKEPYKVPTNITYVVPSHYLKRALSEFLKDGHFAPPKDAMTIEDMMATKTLTNIFDGGRKWKTISAKPDGTFGPPEDENGQGPASGV